MNQEDIQYWLNKGKWTAGVASFLLLGIDPRSHLANLVLDPNEFGELLDHKNRILFDAARRLRQDLEIEIISQTEEVEGELDLWDERKFSRYHLNGFRVLNPYKERGPLEIEFPSKAFKSFAQENVFEGLAVDVPIFGLFHEPEESNIGADRANFAPAPIEQRTEVKDMEIISGITVNQIKRFIDSKSDDYRPRLDVLIRVLIQLEGKPEGTILYKNSFGSICRDLLEKSQIGSQTSKTARTEVSTADIKAIERVISKEKVTTGGRPPKDKEQ